MDPFAGGRVCVNRGLSYTRRRVCLFPGNSVLSTPSLGVPALVAVVTP